MKEADEEGRFRSFAPPVAEEAGETSNANVVSIATIETAGGPPVGDGGIPKGSCTLNAVTKEIVGTSALAHRLQKPPPPMNTEKRRLYSCKR